MHEIYPSSNAELLNLAAGKIIAAISEAFLLVGVDGNIAIANRAAIKLLDYPEGKLIGVPLKEVLPQTDLIREIRESAQSESGRHEIETESYMLTESGRRARVSLSWSGFEDADGKLAGVIIIARDISRQKRNEVLKRKQSNGLVARNEELAALYEIANAIRTTLDRGVLLQRALATITSLPLFEIDQKAGVFSVEGREMRLIASLGESDAFLEAHDGMSIDDCLCGTAARTGKIVFSNSAMSDDRHTIRYPGMKDHGHIIVPLVAAGKVAGVMYLYVPTGSVFSERQFMLLETIGDQLGIAMENARLYEETRLLALHDPLTGLANRRLMALELEKATARAHRTGKPFSLVMLDLDHFKNYNDLYGHAAGDRLLASLGELILHEIRRIDLGVRYGGEEFLLILPETSLEEAREISERIRKKTATEQFECSDNMQTTGITVSLGVAAWDKSLATADILVARADTALYLAKAKGRNRVETWMNPEPLHGPELD